MHSSISNSEFTLNMDELINNRYKFNTQNDRLGSGSYGECFKAHDIQQNKMVVIKRLYASNFTENSFEREAEIMESADHPNIVHCYEHFWDEGKECKSLILILNYYENKDVTSFTQNTSFSKLDRDLVVKWMLQLFHAVQYLHEHQIIHRDLKLSNCFLDKDLNLFLGDFGLSRSLNDSLAKTFAGTIGTMAPEVLLKQKYDYSADIWSLGCVWYELISGRKPFEANGIVQQSVKIVNCEYEKLADTSLPKFVDAINKMLVKNPKERIGSLELLSIFEDEWKLCKAKQNKDQYIVLQDRFKVDYNQDKISGDSYQSCYKGFDLRNGASVMVKVIKLQNNDQENKIEKETQILKCFQHSSIAKEITHFKQNETNMNNLIVIQDYYAQRDLRSFIKQNKQYVENSVIEKWMMQLLNALTFLHNNGILHRDLKLENCFLDEQYNICLGDFGESKFIDQSVAKTFVGTICTLAPEVINGQAYGTPADVWSLGCIWYELVAGVPPFSGMSDTMIHNIKEAKYIALKGVRNDKLINSMLLLDPRQRPNPQHIKNQFQTTYSLDKLEILKVTWVNNKLILKESQQNVNCNDDHLLTLYTSDQQVELKSKLQSKQQKIILYTVIGIILLIAVGICLGVTLSYQKCSANQVLINSKQCGYCPNGSHFENNACICTKPNMNYNTQQNQCICNNQYILDNNSCIQCPSNSNAANGSCVCNNQNQSYIGTLNLCMCQNGLIQSSNNECCSSLQLIQQQCVAQCFSVVQNVFNVTSLLMQTYENISVWSLPSQNNQQYNNSQLNLSSSVFDNITGIVTLFLNQSFLNNVQISSQSIIPQNQVQISVLFLNVSNLTLVCTLINISNIELTQNSSISIIANSIRDNATIMDLNILCNFSQESYGKYCGCINVANDNSTLEFQNVKTSISSLYSLPNGSLFVQSLEFASLKLENISIYLITYSSFYNNILVSYSNNSIIYFCNCELSIGQQIQPLNIQFNTEIQQILSLYAQLQIINSLFCLYCEFNGNQSVQYTGIIMCIKVNTISFINTSISGNLDYSNNTQSNGIFTQIQNQCLFNISNCTTLIQVDGSYQDGFALLNSVEFQNGNQNISNNFIMQKCNISIDIIGIDIIETDAYGCIISVNQVFFNNDNIINIFDIQFSGNINQNQCGILFCLQTYNISINIQQILYNLNLNGCNSGFIVSLWQCYVMCQNINLMGYNIYSQGHCGSLLSSVYDSNANMSNVLVNGTFIISGDFECGGIIGICCQLDLANYQYNNNISIANTSLYIQLTEIYRMFGTIVGSIKQGTVSIRNISQTVSGVSKYYIAYCISSCKNLTVEDNVSC